MEPFDDRIDPITQLKTISLDLAVYQARLHFKDKKSPLIIHFDKPARRFYFSLICLVVAEMKKLDAPGFVYIRKHVNTLKLLDKALAGANASKSEKGRWDKIRKAWRHRLPDLESGTLFKVMNRDQIVPHEKGGKYRYDCSEAEGDIWANLFQYDEKNPWRFKFAIDAASINLHDISVKLGDLEDASAWKAYVDGLEVKAQESPDQKPDLPTNPKKTVFVYTTVLVIFLLAAVIWFARLINVDPPEKHSDSAEKSIAVLPFTNMSADPEQEYFCDGIAEDLITDLSKISGLIVIARNSTFPYKGKAVKVQQIAEDLGVLYVLEGSVRKIAENMRINVQLIDGTTGHHIWAERFDETYSDIFSLQDRINRKIVTALSLKLTLEEEEKLTLRYTENVEAYDSFLRGREQLRLGSEKGLAKAVEFFEKAIELDHGYSSAHAGLANAYRTSIDRNMDKKLGWKDARSRSKKHLQLAMKNPTPYVLYNVARTRLYQRRWDEAIAEAERTVALDPNYSGGYLMMGFVLTYSGRSAEAIDYLKKAMRLDPHNPASCLYVLGLAYYFLERYEEAASALEKSRKLGYGGGPFPLAISYAQMGRGQKAAEILAKYFDKRGWETVCIESTFKYWPFKEQKDLDHWAEGLRKSGLMRPWNPVYRREYTKAIADAKKTLVLKSGDAHALYTMGESLLYSGRSAEAIDYLKRAMSLGAGYPRYYMYTLGVAQFCSEKYEEAATSLEEAILKRKYHNRAPRWLLAATYAYLGRQQEAEDVLTKYIQENKYEGYTVERVLKYYLHAFKDPRDTARFAQGLHKAGLPMN